MAYVVMAYVVMAYIVMADVVMAYTVMAEPDTLPISARARHGAEKLFKA